jgi:DNA recombination protein RmuC
MELLTGLVGLVIGIAVGVVVMQARMRGVRAEGEAATRKAELEAQAQLHQVENELTAASSRADALIAAHEAEKRTADDLRRELRDSFEALASKALKENSAALLEKTDLQLKPFADQLKTLADHSLQLERARRESAGELKEQLQALKRSTVELERRSNDVASALRGSSQARGQWGEMVLTRVFELAGMTEGVHYRTQKQIEGGQRPDFQVLLPGGEAIPVDAKVPMASFLAAQAENDPGRRREFLEQHARDLKGHVNTLAKKDYAGKMEGEFNFTVMFLPGAHLLEAAFQSAPHLQEEAIARNVLIATPVTLLALLKTVGIYWNQDKLARNAQEIAETAKEYHARLRVFTQHLEKTGAGLKSAVSAYNKAIGSYNRNVLPQGRRLEENADIAANRAIDEPAVVEQEPREDLIT